jgi:hypothetical protein
MKRPNADEISRWLMDDTLVADGRTKHSDGSWSDWIRMKHLITGWDEIRVSIATVEGKPVFEGDTYYSPTGCEHTAPYPQLISSYTKDYWSKCTLTPPKPKSVLDGKEFNELTFYSHEKTVEKLKEFILTHFEEKK